MKKKMHLILALVMAAAMIMTVSLAAAETKITVSGTGETQVSADTAVISVGVSARDKDVMKAQQKVNEAIAAIREALKGQGVEEENINTDYMNIYAIYDYDGEEEQVQAYNASTTLAVKVTDLDTVGLLIDEAIGAGANTLNGISFSAADTEAAKAASLKLAVEQARAKAEALAEAAGMKITGMEIITEGGTFSYSNSVGNFYAKSADAAETETTVGTVVQAAKLIVSATVSITFTAE